MKQHKLNRKWLNRGLKLVVPMYTDEEGYAQHEFKLKMRTLSNACDVTYTQKCKQNRQIRRQMQSHSPKYI